MYWLRQLFDIACIILTATMFVGSQGFISLPSFMLVSAAVSEIRESNQNKKKKNCYFKFTMHIISHFLTRVTF